MLGPHSGGGGGHQDVRAVLDRLMTRVRAIDAELNDLRTLSQQLDALKATKGAPFKTLVDVGCHFYVQARVDDPRTVLLHLGCGYHVEMGLDEAQRHIARRDRVLTQDLERLNADAMQLQTQIYAMADQRRRS